MTERTIVPVASSEDIGALLERNVWPIDKLVPALLAAQSAFPVIGFDATNPHFKNRYATLAHIIAETRPALAANGLAISQLIEGDVVVTMLMHTSGQRLVGRTPIVSEKPGPQAMGSGITYARRYGLCAILGIAAEEDDDGEGSEQRDGSAKLGARGFAPREPQRPMSHVPPVAVEHHENDYLPPGRNEAVRSNEMPWFDEPLTGGKFKGKTWREMSQGTLGGQRMEYLHWMVNKAERIKEETRERARYVLNLYQMREAGE